MRAAPVPVSRYTHGDRLIHVPNFKAPIEEPAIIIELQSFEYGCRRVVRDGENPVAIRHLLIDGYYDTMKYLPAVAGYRGDLEYGMEKDFETEELIIMVYARGWLKQRSDGSTMMLP